MLCKRERSESRHLAEMPLADRAAVIDNKAEVDDFRIGCSELFPQRVEKPRQQIVVAVHKEHIFATRALQTHVSGVPEAAVRLVNDDRAIRRLRCQTIAQSPALAVGGAVVHEDDLIVVSALCYYRAEAGFKIVPDVVDRDHDAESHCTASFLRSCTR